MQKPTKKQSRIVTRSLCVAEYNAMLKNRPELELRAMFEVRRFIGAPSRTAIIPSSIRDLRASLQLGGGSHA
jgi:hypothetical protein